MPSHVSSSPFPLFKPQAWCELHSTKHALELNTTDSHVTLTGCAVTSATSLLSFITKPGTTPTTIKMQGCCLPNRRALCLPSVTATRVMASGSLPKVCEPPDAAGWAQAAGKLGGVSVTEAGSVGSAEAALGSGRSMAGRMAAAALRRGRTIQEGAAAIDDLIAQLRGAGWLQLDAPAPGTAATAATATAAPATAATATPLGQPPGQQQGGSGSAMIRTALMVTKAAMAGTDVAATAGSMSEAAGAGSRTQHSGVEHAPAAAPSPAPATAASPTSCDVHAATAGEQVELVGRSSSGPGAAVWPEGGARTGVLAGGLSRASLSEGLEPQGELQSQPATAPAAPSRRIPSQQVSPAGAAGTSRGSQGGAPANMSDLEVLYRGMVAIVDAKGPLYQLALDSSGVKTMLAVPMQTPAVRKRLLPAMRTLLAGGQPPTAEIRQLFYSCCTRLSTQEMDHVLRLACLLQGGPEGAHAAMLAREPYVTGIAFTEVRVGWVTIAHPRHV